MHVWDGRGASYASIAVPCLYLSQVYWPFSSIADLASDRGSAAKISGLCSMPKSGRAFPGGTGPLALTWCGPRCRGTWQTRASRARPEGGDWTCDAPRDQITQSALGSPTDGVPQLRVLVVSPSMTIVIYCAARRSSTRRWPTYLLP